MRPPSKGHKKPHAASKKLVFDPGSRTNRDPDHMASIISSTTAQSWVDDLQKHMPDHPALFSNWDRDFVSQMSRKSDFNGRQIVLLRVLLEKLIEQSARTLKEADAL